MKRNLFSECPLCAVPLNLCVTLGNLGCLDCHKDPVTEVKVQWGTGLPDPPPTAIYRDFTPECPSCLQTLNARILIEHLPNKTPDSDVVVTMDLWEEDEGSVMTCANCSKEVNGVYEDSLCLQCFSQKWDFATEKPKT